MDKETLRVRSKSIGFDLFGVAPADEFPAVPEWAASIVVVGMAVLDPAFDMEMYIQAAGEKRWSKWVYKRIVAGAARLSLALVDSGFRSVPLTFEDSLSVLDLKDATGRAGLGVRGLNNLVVTPQFGPRVRFGALFTDLALEADPPKHDYYCASCSLCIAACPTGALSPAGFDRSRCIAEFEPDATIASLQREMLEFPTPHTRRQCAACVSACPIGKRIPTRSWALDPS